MKKHRNNLGQFIKGNTASPGRPKGSTNEKADRIRETLITFIDKNLERLQAEFEALEPKDKFDVLFKMAKFVLPTLKAVEFGNILDELTEDDFTELIERLKKDVRLNPGLINN